MQNKHQFTRRNAAVLRKTKGKSYLKNDAATSSAQIAEGSYQPCPRRIPIDTTSFSFSDILSVKTEKVPLHHTLYYIGSRNSDSQDCQRSIFPGRLYTLHQLLKLNFLQLDGIEINLAALNETDKLSRSSGRVHEVATDSDVTQHE
jgi:hypothetical protein